MDDPELVSSAPAPPVVAVMVVHDPGPWFNEVLAALAAQDYPNLRSLFLLTGSEATLDEQIRSVLPDAHVRPLPLNPGFGASANEVMRLVEGDQGFFCFLHDDVTLAPDAITQLVEELYRSNAGVVGPKILEWEDQRRIQSVGLRVDRFGFSSGVAERGDSDQEQHDAVRDVFCLSTACLLVRADLFRAVGGFESSIEYDGDGLDLCWRAHLGGARVMVVPAATARHRASLSSRVEDHRGVQMAARHGLLTALALSSPVRAVVTLLLAPIVGVISTVAGLFSGSPASGLATLRASGAAFTRLGSVLRRRRVVQRLRSVPDHEISPLQARGSLQLGQLLRRRHETEEVRDRTRVARRTLRSAGKLAVGSWLAIAVVFLIGSRSILGRRMPVVGTFLPIPSSAMRLFHTYASGWWPSGLGRTEAAPTGVALLGVANAFSFGHPGLLRMLLVLGPIVAGYIGVFHFAAVFRSTRSRVAALVAYVVNPLPYAAIAAGRWAPLAVYGAFPWALELLRRASGIQAASSVTDAEGVEITDAVALVGIGRQIRLAAALALLEAVVAAFVPVFPLLVLVAAAAIALATLGARGTLASLAGVGSAAIAAIAAFALHLPWSLRYLEGGGWRELMGNGEHIGSLGLARIARFEIGHVPLGPLSLALIVPLLAGVLLAQGWRLTWMARSAGLFLVFGALALFADSGSVLPETGVLLVPMAMGLALAAAGSVAAFDDDVKGGRIGWRQPVGLAPIVALSVAVVPFVAGMGSGQWQAPSAELAGTLGALPVNPQTGDFRVLYLGDSRLLPLPGRPYRDGVSYAVSDDGPLDVLDAWAPRDGAGDALIVEALDAIRSNSTLRGGHLLAPLGIRYVVVPLIDGLQSRRSRPLAAPRGLEDAFSDQVDLKRSTYVSDQAIVFENTAALPLRALLVGRTQQASQTAGPAALVRADFSEVIPVMIGQSPPGSARDTISASTPGSLHDATGKDPRWTLRVNGQVVAPRSAFGWSVAYDLPDGGEVRLRYDTSVKRHLGIALQVVLWALALIATSRFRGWRRWLVQRRQRRLAPATPVIRLDDTEGGNP